MPIQFTPDELLHFVRWTDALKSGQYEQCCGALGFRIDERQYYCAVGVGYVVEGRRDTMYKHAADSLTTAVTGKLMDARCVIVELNDLHRWPFPRIAERMLAVYAEQNPDVPLPALAET